jgi:sialic acid synthase SpsE
MNLFGKDTRSHVIVIAEIGNNHEGDVGVARELIHRAAAAGADAVKVQIFRPSHYVTSRNPARLEMLERFRLSEDEFLSLRGEADKAGIAVFATPFDLDSVRVAAALGPVVKISSGDNTFLPLIDAVAALGMPAILSAGLASLAQLRYAKARLDRSWDRQGVDPGLAVLHCVSAYPTPPEHVNLSAIAELERALGCTVGYSDHTLGNTAATLAVAAGARIVEKHFTLSKSYSDFRDHQLSADPDEMAELVSAIRLAETLMGDARQRPNPAEEGNRVAMRRSIAAACDIAAGTVLGWDHLTWVRPGDGLAPGDEARLLGRRTTVAIAAGEPISVEQTG